jgi:mRNA-degrading endonuclease RelE of RelBE toxin-antitoxin system
MNIKLTPPAERDLEKIDCRPRGKLLEAIKKLQHFPQVAGVKKLEGDDNGWRLRKGSWRVTFEIHGQDIFILHIRDRRDAYRD